MTTSTTQAATDPRLVGWKHSRITTTFGLEISDRRLFSDADPSIIPSLLSEHSVLVIRGQNLSHKEQVDLAREIGEPTPAHPVVPGLPGYPEILVLDAAQGGKNARWHTDVTFVATPPAASVLVADHVPPQGGDTLFADLGAAYRSLSEPLQHLADGLEAVHRITPLAYWGEPADTALTRDDALKLLEDSRKLPAVIHPLVRVHPVTGRKALFVNPGFTSHIIGLSRIESENLLRLFFEHATRPEVTLRHRWNSGDVLIWDNQTTMHYATDDYGKLDRRMRRVTVRGDNPRGPMGDTSRVSHDPFLTTR